MFFRTLFRPYLLDKKTHLCIIIILICKVCHSRRSTTVSETTRDPHPSSKGRSCLLRKGCQESAVHGGYRDDTSRRTGGSSTGRTPSEVRAVVHFSGRGVGLSLVELW